MKTITDLTELDRELRYVDERFAVSDDEGRKALAAFTYAAERDLPPTRTRPSTAPAQMRLYHAISSRPSYRAAENESSRSRWRR